MLVISDMNNLHSSLINEERLRLGTGRENTNIERCTESLSRGEKKTSRKIKWTWNSQSKYKDTKGRKTPAFRHLEYTCLIILMWQNALRKQKFLHPTHAPLSQRCVLIINGLGSRPVWGKKVRNNQKNQTSRFLRGHYQFYAFETFRWKQRCTFVANPKYIPQERYKQFFHVAMMTQCYS